MKHFTCEFTWIPVPLPPEKRFAYDAAWKVIFDILDELEAQDQSAQDQSDSSESVTKNQELDIS